MIGPLTLVAILLAFFSLIFFLASIWAARKRFIFRTARNFLFALLLLSLSALFATLAVATQGYRALTHEEVAAVVTTEPIGPKRFRVRFQYPNGEQSSFTLQGDELYVDAHILKWKPVANILGLHTSYELDRVAGRYMTVEDERSGARTLFSLAREKPLDMFELRRFYGILSPLLDVQYGSATFSPVTKSGRFELRVSTTGLLLREVGGEDGK